MSSLLDLKYVAVNCCLPRISTGMLECCSVEGNPMKLECFKLVAGRTSICVILLEWAVWRQTFSANERKISATRSRVSNKWGTVLSLWKHFYSWGFHCIVAFPHLQKGTAHSCRCLGLCVLTGVRNKAIGMQYWQSLTVAFLQECKWYYN